MRRTLGARTGAILVGSLTLAAMVPPVGSGAVGPAARAQVPAAPTRHADFNGDGYEDLAVGAPFEDLAGVEAGGAVNVLYGSADGLSGTGSRMFTQDVAGVGSRVEAADLFGYALAAGDLDHDGYDDLAVGAPGEDATALVDAGAVNVLYGSAAGLSGTGSQIFTQDTPGVGSTVESYERFGEALATGDLDGDEVVDVVVGAPFESVGAVPWAGAVHALFGSAAGLSGTGSQTFTQDTAGVGSSAEPYDLFGGALAVGDFDGDGPGDLAVGTVSEDVGAVEDAGAVNVFPGSAAGLSGTGSQIFTQDTEGVASSAERTDGFGGGVVADDFDADGADDLAVAAATETVGSLVSAGAVHVLDGSTGGLSGTGSQLFTQDSPGVEGTAEMLDVFGGGLAAGDVDGDGAADLAIGSPSELSGGAAGTANVLYGSAEGVTGTGSQLVGQDSPGVPDAAEPGDRFGETLTTGDHDGDGIDDVTVGVVFESVGAAAEAGAVHVLPGSAAGIVLDGSLMFTQDSPGVGSPAEAGDGFGSALGGTWPR